MQMMGFLFHGAFQGAVQSVQLLGHMVKGTRQQAQLVGQIAVRSGGIKAALFNLQAGAYQMVERGDDLAANATQRDKDQQQDPAAARQRNDHHQLHLVFGIMLQ